MKRGGQIMIANAMLIVLAVLVACLFYLMGELKFLVPYKRLVFHQYGIVLLVWLGILFVNLFAAVYWIQRKFFLKDTGRKLRHIDSQTSGSPMSISLPDGDWNAR
jgi:Na+/phosphate symporter